MTFRVLVIGLWGFPGGWYRARYRPIIVRDRDRMAKLSSWTTCEGFVEAHSTTIVVAKVFNDLGCDVYLKIYGLDTLASPQRLDPSRIKGDDVRVRLVKELNGYIDEFVDRDPERYIDVVERAKKILELFVRGYVDEVDSSLRKCISYEALSILPGIGTFIFRGRNGNTKKYIYGGSPLNTYTALQLDLLHVLEDIDPDLVVLDISHGVNYLPVLGREAVHRCLEIFSALKRKRTVLAVVNSDPVSEQDQEAYIHLIELKTFEVRPTELLKSLVENLDRDQLKLRMLVQTRPSEEFQTVNRYIEDIYKRFEATMKAIVEASSHGLALYLVHRLSKLCLDELQKIAEDIGENLRNLVNNRSIYKKDNIIVVEHTYAIPSSILNLLYALYLLKNLIKVIERVDRINGFVELESLKKLAQEIGLSDIALTILNTELYNLRKSVEALNTIGIDISRPMLYGAIINILETSAHRVLDAEKRSEVIREAIENGEKKICRLDKRNFYAHAGMERNVIEVFVKNNKVYVGYAPRCLDVIDSLFKD